MNKTVKFAEVSCEVAATAFAMLNPGRVSYEEKIGEFGAYKALVTDTNPEELTYPEGWSFSKGCFTNKHNSTIGLYTALVITKSNGDTW